MAQVKYNYTPLPKRRDTGASVGSPNLKKPIRLLNLLPGGFNDTLIGQLIVYQLKVLEAPVEDARRQDDHDLTDPRSPTTIDGPQEGEFERQYEALSYSWGQKNSDDDFCINILNEKLSCQGLEVTPNLHSALKHLRHKTETRCLWVDAIVSSFVITFWRDVGWNVIALATLSAGSTPLTISWPILVHQSIR